MRESIWFRGAIAGLAGGIAWLIGLVIFFGPAQGLLTDPGLQSVQMLAAFSGEPPPRTVASPGILVLGLLTIGLLWGCVYASLARAWADSWWRRGWRFSLVAWVLMVPWFEFYLPWNVLHEPAPLVLLELACWAGVLLVVGAAIAGVEQALRPRAVAPVCAAENV